MHIFNKFMHILQYENGNSLILSGISEDKEHKKE